VEDPDRFYRSIPSPGGRRQSLLPLPWWEGLGEGVRRWDFGHALPPPPDRPHQGGFLRPPALREELHATAAVLGLAHAALDAGHRSARPGDVAILSRMLDAFGNARK